MAARQALSQLRASTGERVDEAFLLLLRLFDNIKKNPSDAKFRRISCSNSRIQSQLLCFEGSHGFLEAAGFVKEIDGSGTAALVLPTSAMISFNDGHMALRQTYARVSEAKQSSAIHKAEEGSFDERVKEVLGMIPGVEATLLRRAAFKEMPWANGLGVTREIAADRTPAPQADSGHGTLAPFCWRLSMADLAAPGGPFSQLCNVDRVLTLLEGEGVTVAVNGEEAVELKPHETFKFPGDVPTTSTVGSTTGRDLNTMWDRTRCKASVSIVTGPAMLMLPPGLSVAFAVAIGGDASVAVTARGAVDRGMFDMGKEDAVRFDVDLCGEEVPPQKKARAGSDGTAAVDSSDLSLKIGTGTVYAVFLSLPSAKKGQSRL